MTLSLSELKELIPSTYIYRDVSKPEAQAVSVNKYYVDQFGTMYLGCDVEQPQLASKLVTE